MAILPGLGCFRWRLYRGLKAAPAAPFPETMGLRFAGVHASRRLM
jgi:hypothetical protein